MRNYQSVYHILCLWTFVTCTGIRQAAAVLPAAYHITDLGTLGGFSSFGNGINASGHVTGQSYTNGYADPRAFLYDGALLDLGTLGGTFSTAGGINASGQVTGYASTTGDAARHAFLYDRALFDLGTLNGTNSYGYGINDSGQVTGFSDIAGDVASHAFLYDGTLHDLGTFGGVNSFGSDINRSGQVTGHSQIEAGGAHAFLWTPTTSNGSSGTMHDLGTLGGETSEGLGINDSGQVVGNSHTTGNLGDHAFLWTPTTPNAATGAMIDLGTLGGIQSLALDVNNGGQAVGYSTTTGDREYRAFLYTSSSRMVDLNTLIDPLPGWELANATGINDAGQITGSGYINGTYHAFLLTPVPEPTSLALLGLSAASFAALGLRDGAMTFLLCRKPRRKVATKLESYAASLAPTALPVLGDVR